MMSSTRRRGAQQAEEVRRLIISASQPTDPGLTPLVIHPSEVGTCSAPRGPPFFFFFFPFSRNGLRHPYQRPAPGRDGSGPHQRPERRSGEAHGRRLTGLVGPAGEEPAAAAAARRGAVVACHGHGEEAGAEPAGGSRIWDFPSRHASSPSI